jgi:hypothetical protein
VWAGKRLVGQCADHGEAEKPVGVVGGLLQGAGQVGAGVVSNLVDALLPLEAFGDIVDLALIGDIDDALAAVIFLEFFSGEDSHSLLLAEGNVEQHHDGQANHAAARG